MTTTRWEYRTLKHQVAGFLTPKLDTNELDADYSRLGSEGWELVKCLDINVGEGASWFLLSIFRRPLGVDESR